MKIRIGMVLITCSTLIIGLMLIMLCASTVPPAFAGDPCCSITGMAAGGLVTAQETATGKTFQFQVTNQVLAKSLRVGQTIHADFTTMKVSVQPDGGSPCCNISSAASGPTGTAKLPNAPMPTVHGVEPCCGITGMAAGGLVTAQDTATGKTFQFQVTNQVLAKSLRVGQKVYADFGTQQVSVDGASPCCGIVSAASGPTGTAKLPNAPMPTVHGVEPCCNVVANGALKGRLGRVVVAFPSGAVPKSTSVEVLKDGKKLQSGYGNKSWELPSGTYEVSISGKQVPNVTVKAGHDTNVKVGVLRVSAGKGNSVDVLDGGHKLTSGYGDQIIGLPPGAFNLKVAGQTQPVTISEGQVTDF